MELPNLEVVLASQKGDRSLRRVVLALCLWGQPPVVENTSWPVTITCVRSVFLLIACNIA